MPNGLKEKKYKYNIQKQKDLKDHVDTNFRYF